MSTTELARTLLTDEPQSPGCTFAEAAGKLIERIDAGTPIIDTLPTTWALLDETTGGLTRGEFCGIVAAPGMGKSTLADQLIVNTLLANPGTRALICNLETSVPIRVARLVAGRAVELGTANKIVRCVPLGPLLRGELLQASRERTKAVAAELAAAVGDRLRFVDDQYNAEGIARLIQTETPDLVCIDHTGLLNMAGGGSAVERFDEALHTVTTAIREVNAAGVFIAELNKAALSSGTPDFAAVRGSARFASLAGQLVRLLQTNDGQDDPLLTAVLRKNRHGRGLVQQNARFFGGLGYLHWIGAVEPIPQRGGPRGSRDDRN